jgi:hypothetical protein
LEYVNKFDIVFLNETWISQNDNINLDIPGYCSEHLFGNKSKNTNKGRFSGGISIYFKTFLKTHLKIVEKLQCGIVCVKLQKSIFDSDEDLYIGHAYIPPSSSNIFRFEDFDFFETLETLISKYNNIGKIIFTGDLNSRTSDFPDFICFDKYLDNNLMFVNNDDIPLRKRIITPVFK